MTKKDSQSKFDLIIIGGGIMGLCTAYYATQSSKTVLIIDRSTIGNSKSGSGGLTRSYRNDYLDPLYSELAYQSRTLWRNLEKELKTTFLVECGVLNIVQSSLTPNLKMSYAVESYLALKKQFRRCQKFSRKILSKTYPQFKADLGILDVEAGFIDVTQGIFKLKRWLLDKNVKIFEKTNLISISSDVATKGTKMISTDQGDFFTNKLVITAGLGTNSILESIVGYPNFRFPLTPDRPIECQYFIPKRKNLDSFRYQNFPVFAYLDVGIYGHPIFNQKTKGVKIGYFHPPKLNKTATKVKNVMDFVRRCIPTLSQATVHDVVEVDQCSYVMTPDEEFVVGPVPLINNVWVGTGFCGTGFKFAPIIGKMLARMAFQNANVAPVKKFDPARFISIDN